MAKLLQLCLFVVFAAVLTQSAAAEEAAMDIEKVLGQHNRYRNQLSEGNERTQPGEKCYMKMLKWNDCIAENAKIKVQAIKDRKSPTLKNCGMEVEYNQKWEYFNKDKPIKLEIGWKINHWWMQIKEVEVGAEPHKLGNGVIGNYRKLAGANVEYVGCAQLSWEEGGWGQNAYVCGYGPSKYTKYPIYISKDDSACKKDECAEFSDGVLTNFLCTKMKGEEEEGDEDCDEE